jgi:winged helix-turn-helix DNA-binding protein
MGKTQQAVLDRLADAEHGNLTVTALAKRVGVSIRQILSAVQALEERGRVCISREDSTSEWTGRYGDLTIAANVRLRSGGMPPNLSPRAAAPRARERCSAVPCSRFGAVPAPRGVAHGGGQGRSPVRQHYWPGQRITLGILAVAARLLVPRLAVDEHEPAAVAQPHRDGLLTAAAYAPCGPPAGCRTA